MKQVMGMTYIGEEFSGRLINEKLMSERKKTALPMRRRVGNAEDTYLCGHGGDIISITMHTTINTSTSPYRLQLEAWQGNSAFVRVALERIGTLHPNAMTEGDDMLHVIPPELTELRRQAEIREEKRIMLQLIKVSMLLDAQDVSTVLVENIFNSRQK